jgi:hypothetical protein
MPSSAGLSPSLINDVILPHALRLSERRPGQQYLLRDSLDVDRYRFDFGSRHVGAP